MKKQSNVLIGILLFAWLGLTVYLAVARGMTPPCPPDRAKPNTISTQPPTLTKPQPPRKKASPFSQFAKPFEFSVDFFGLTYRGLSSNLIDQQVLRFGAYEKDVLFFMRDALQALAGKDGVFVDVGANTGHHTLFMSKHAARVHAFEPYPPVLARLRAIISLNKLSHVFIHPVGLGSEKKEVAFNAPPDENLGSGSFVPNYQPGNKEAGKLRIVRGDDALKEAGLKKVHLIKIDIEGYEKPALAGLKKTLESSRPTVVLELTIDPRHAEVFKSAPELKGAFPAGYRFSRLLRTRRGARTGTYRLVPYGIDFSRLGQQMLVVYPKEHAAEILRLSAGAAR